MSEGLNITLPVTMESVTNAYYKYRASKYMLEHPGADLSKAYKYARVAWARKLKRHPLQVLSADQPNNTKAV